MKSLRCIIMLFVALATIAACEKNGGDVDQPIAVESVTISPGGPVTLVVGEEITLNATIAPEDAATKEVQWESDSPSVATVNADGNVAAKSVGTAIITAYADGKSATCRVDVVQNVVAVEEVTITPTGNHELTVGDELQLSAVVTPDNATDKHVLWSSSASGVASVNDNGLVTALAAGTTTITATVGDRSDEVEVTVKDAYVAVTDILTNVEGDTLKLYWGHSFQLETTVVPENATDQTITFSFLRGTDSGYTTVPESELMTITEDGYITAIQNQIPSVAPGEILVMTAGDYEEYLYIFLIDEPEVEMPTGWTKTESGATYGGGGALDNQLQVTITNGVCTSALYTGLVREATATDIENQFPESFVESFSITGRGTVATIELMNVKGCKEYFEGKSLAEIFELFAGNEAAILKSWSEGFSATAYCVDGWEMADIDTIGYIWSSNNDDMRIWLSMNTLTGLVDSGKVYMFINNYSNCSEFFYHYWAEVLNQPNYDVVIDLEEFNEYILQNSEPGINALQILDGYSFTELMTPSTRVHDELAKIFWI